MSDCPDCAALRDETIRLGAIQDRSATAIKFLEKHNAELAHALGREKTRAAMLEATLKALERKR